MNITVDAREFVSKHETHAALRSVLGEENYWGSNLDALYDCLTSKAEPTKLTIINWSFAMTHLRGYADRLWHVLYDASEENHRLSITIE